MTKGDGHLKKILVLLVLAGLAWYGHGKYQAAHSAVPEPNASYNGHPPPEFSSETTSADATFTCDGRTMCSQMTSCAEATYFIQHCPNTKMDGNNDGVPCERQWCN